MPELVAPLTVEENGLKVASLLDLAGTKASVVQVRAEAKDYLDIDALLQRTSIDLPLALAAAQAMYGTSFNPQIILTALSYFGEGDLQRLPELAKDRLAAAVRSVDLDRLPDLHGNAVSINVHRRG